MKLSIYQLATGWRPFQIRLQDFAAQPSHSIYIPVAARSGSSGDAGLAGVTRDLKSIQSLLRPDKEHWLPENCLRICSIRPGRNMPGNHSPHSFWQMPVCF
jgi:hypothetical protein